MSRYSARRLRQNRYKNWREAVARWEKTPFKRNRKNEPVKIPELTLCKTCYYRVCRCPKEGDGHE